MPDNPPKGSAARPTDRAIGDIVKMNPRKVTVTLTLPVSQGPDRPMIELEWVREDSTMPLSELLTRIEEYVSHFGVK
ncbi:MAG: hypothetical protein ACREDK_07480 [Thermoplasmata archaeon]